MRPRDDGEGPGLGGRLGIKVFGPPRDVEDPNIFHKISLLPFFAWIGLGADGLSSSAYGPEAAFRNLEGRHYLSLAIGLATALTVLVIAYSYTRIIERFPNGGGGYLVATKMLGKGAGLVSGSALVVDYILTITVSIAASVDAVFSYLPLEWQAWKVPAAAALIMLLIVLNIRGVKESIAVLAPIFLVFLGTHVVLLAYGVASRAGEAGAIASEAAHSLRSDLSAIGLSGILLVFLRAYSLGGGTYTGIEAVSNGMQIMREPRVRTGKRTMAYLAGSLAITASGLVVCYLFARVAPEEGRTLNATLADALYAGFGEVGIGLALVTILSEGALLLVAAQAGFIDAPRVMANMAVDSWLPRRFADFSARLTMLNGIVLIGGSAIALLLFTGGSINALVTMYSINVFLTFSLSEFSMVRHFVMKRKRERITFRSIAIQALAFLLCVTILFVTVYEKFSEGGWLTLLITGLLIGLCAAIRRHYASVGQAVERLDALIPTVEADPGRSRARKLDPGEMTAIQLVSGYNGLGVHTFLQVRSAFPGLYRNFVFLSVAVVDQAMFREGESVPELKGQVEAALLRYVELARKQGFAAEGRSGIGTDVVEAATELCRGARRDYPRSTVFSGNLVFSRERLFHGILHNETAFAVQRRLQWEGITNVVMPIRIRLGKG